MIKKIFTVLFITFSLTVFNQVLIQTVQAAPCANAMAQYFDRATNQCQPFSKELGVGDADKSNMSKPVAYIQKFAILLSILSSGIAVVMIVYSGFVYTFSQGDAKLIGKAKFYITSAGVGMFISSACFVIYNLIKTAGGF
jgi:hypothetical protein